MFLAEWGRRIWYLLNRRRFDRELREEIEAHREMAAFPRNFGNSLRLREESQDVWGWTWLDHAWQDFRFALRTLRRSPGFALTGCAILSIGIGVNLTLFQLVYAMFLRPLPVADVDSLVYFHYHTQTESGRSSSSLVLYPVTQFIQSSPALSAVLTEYRAEVTWEDEEAQRLPVSFVSANWFQELGYSAAAGRVFTDAIDGGSDSSPVVVVSYSFWRDRFASDPDIIGRTVRINGQSAVVVGVAAEGFPGLRRGAASAWTQIQHARYFLPHLAMAALEDAWVSSDTYARLRPGVSVDVARQVLRDNRAALSSERPMEFPPQIWLEPYAGSDRFQTPADRAEALPVIVGLFGLTGLLLLVSCANLGGLVLSRAFNRARDWGVRLALGATRWRIVRQLLAESFVLAAIGALGGLLLITWLAPFLGVRAGVSAHLDFSPDLHTLLAAALVAAVAMLLVGLAPAWRVSAQPFNETVKDGGAQVTAGFKGMRLRRWLLVSQVAGSCLLLVLAITTAGALQSILSRNPGFEFENALVIEPQLSTYGMQEAEAVAFWNQVKTAVAESPETVAASLVSDAPFGESVSHSTRFTGDPQEYSFTRSYVEPAFFSLMKIPVLRGRAFNATDDPDKTVILSRRMAVAMYGTADVVGEGFPRTAPAQRIIGVVGDAPFHRMHAPDQAQTVYVPMRSGGALYASLVVRAKSDPALLTPLVRDAVRRADDRVITQPQLLRDRYEEKLAAPRLARAVTSLAALLAVALACIGVFGIVSHGVRLRLKEIGIRIALGASHAEIAKLVAGQSAALIVLGITIGLVGSSFLMKLFAGEPFYLAAPNRWSYLTALLIFFAAAALALATPMRRALHTDPSTTLRQE